MEERVTAPEATHQAVELILADERLTSDLEDADASTVLHWATALARQEALLRICTDPLASREAVAETVRPVRQIVRAINDLVADYSSLDTHELVTRLLALVDASRKLKTRP